MTINIQEIDKMDSDTAKLYLNNMMKDITRVRIQVNTDRSGAKNIIDHDSEIIDTVVELLFEKIDGEKDNIAPKIDRIKKLSKNVDEKAYHALGYNDGYVEQNLKLSMEEISDLNKNFVKFIKDRKSGDTAELTSSKQNFSDSLSKYKDSMKSYTIEKKDVVDLETLIDDNEAFASKSINSIEKLEEKYEEEGTMLPQVLTTITIAAIASKLAGGIINMFKKKRK